MEISQKVNDEFIVLPGTTTQSNALIDITRMRSHDSIRDGAGGRQHRPADPRTTLSETELVEGKRE